MRLALLLLVAFVAFVVFVLFATSVALAPLENGRRRKSLPTASKASVECRQPRRPTADAKMGSFLVAQENLRSTNDSMALNP